VLGAAAEGDLPVVFRCRLSKGAISAAAFSNSGSGGGLLAAACPEERRVWLLQVSGREQVVVLGFVGTPGEGQGAGGCNGVRLEHAR
jgi:hypothetical protein